MPTTNEDTRKLSYPQGETIRVFENDDAWNHVDAWWKLSDRLIKKLHVVTYNLPMDEYGCVDLERWEWDQIAKELLEKYPHHVFVYVGAGQ